MKLGTGMSLPRLSIHEIASSSYAPTIDLTKATTLSGEHDFGPSIFVASERHQRSAEDQRRWLNPFQCVVNVERTAARDAGRRAIRHAQ
jgi:hypothetical protein